jgi:hydroxyethylthiazole kinase-like uncharacterized protein yjeF
MKIASNISVTSRKMRIIERTGEKIGVSKLMMMENAGASVARFIHNHFYSENDNSSPSLVPLNVVIVAGTGNNGGDSFVAARHLAFWTGKFNVCVVLVGDESRISSLESNTNWEALSHVKSVREVRVTTTKEIAKLSRELRNASIIVSAIFGTGFRGKPRELQRLAIKQINQTPSALKISVDVPSGLEADTGKCEYAVESDVTIALHAPKRGMISSPEGRRKSGEIIIANIGLPF